MNLRSEVNKSLGEIVLIADPFSNNLTYLKKLVQLGYYAVIVLTLCPSSLNFGMFSQHLLAFFSVGYVIGLFTSLLEMSL